MGLCPFHEDHSPSLVINTAKNVWHCLGACQTGGSVIDWTMKAEGGLFSSRGGDAAKGRVIHRDSAAASFSYIDVTEGGEALYRGQARRVYRQRRGYAGSASTGHRLLPRYIEAEPGGIRLSGEARS
jgi:DNA primase